MYFSDNFETSDDMALTQQNKSFSIRRHKTFTIPVIQKSIIQGQRFESKKLKKSDSNVEQKSNKSLIQLQKLNQKIKLTILTLKDLSGKVNYIIRQENTVDYMIMNLVLKIDQIRMKVLVLKIFDK